MDKRSPPWVAWPGDKQCETPARTAAGLAGDISQLPTAKHQDYDVGQCVHGGRQMKIPLSVGSITGWKPHRLRSQDPTRNGSQIHCEPKSVKYSDCF